jgi:hypothetical protein
VIANRRAPVRALCAGGVLLLAAAAAPAAAADTSGGRPVPVCFDSIIVSPARFSPNGDAVQDSVNFHFVLAESLLVFIYVNPAGSNTTVRVVQPEALLRPQIAYDRFWSGYGDDTFLQPEGTYDVFFEGRTPAGQLKFRNQRQVQIDLTSPMVQITAVSPRHYTPTLPAGAGVVPRIDLLVTSSEIDDAIGVLLRDSHGVTRDTLRVSGGFSGNGDYVVLCQVCTSPTLTDGVYTLRAFGKDAAGNQHTALDSLDKNTLAPVMEIAHPRRPRTVQLADSLVGDAHDRQVVTSVSMQVGPPLDTLLVLVPRGGAPSPTFRFNVDVSQLFAAEGTYPVVFRSQDADSLVDSLKVNFRVDRTPPAPPLLSPPLPAQTKSPALVGAALVDTSQVVGLVVGGGAGPPDTLAVTNPRRGFARTLLPGPNTLFFESIDRAHNISAATTATVVWETSTGVVASERFHAGQSIQVDVGDTPAASVSVRILALDGSLVRTFTDASSKRVYSFPWDLTTPDGRAVKNGAYLVVARVVYSAGTESLYRQMIAVAE